MNQYFIQANATDVSVVIRIVDATDGSPETAVTSATPGLDLRYRREGAASVALTEVDLSLLTDAHTDGGLLHIGAGYYRLDLPDAAVLAGASGALVFGTATGMVVIGCYIHVAASQPSVHVVSIEPDAIDDDAIAATARTMLQALILSDATPFAGANLDMPLSDLATAGAVAAVIAALLDLDGRIPPALINGLMPSGVEEIDGDPAAAVSLASNIDNLDGAISAVLTAIAAVPNAAGILAALTTDSTKFAGADVPAIKAKTDNLPSAVLRNTALPNFTFYMVDSSGDAATGQTVTARRRIDGGAFGLAANSVVEVGGGWYSHNIAASDHNGETIAWEYTAAGARTRTFTIVTRPA